MVRSWTTWPLTMPIVSFAGPAARFCLRYRDRLFPDVPLLMGGVDGRHLRNAALRSNDAFVAMRLDPSRIVENALQVLPDTTNIAVVLGVAPNEEFWADELRREFRAFEDRVGFTWLTGMSLQEVEQRVATLPPHSAVFYASFIRDSGGITYEYDRALAGLKASSRAPIFGVFEDQIGQGVVGGPVCSCRELGQQAARAANCILCGEDPAGIRTETAGLGPPVFDWNELQRWGIGDRRLPPGSTVRFKPPSLWEEHRILMLLGAGFVVLETGLVAVVLLNRARRRRAEAEARVMAGLILTAHEDERRRLARELHDDVTQRLACLAIDAGLIGKVSPTGANGGRIETIQQGLARLSEDVHALSYRLHPSILDDLGLPEALQAECDEFSTRESVRAEFHARDLPSRIPQAAALCLYRVAQAALRNVARHAKAAAVDVSLRRLDGGLQLAVTDDGVGFNPAASRGRPSVGHASMRERVHLLGGELEIESAPGRGTVILAWVPLNGDPS
jgi:signal transduction histidine kinase